MSDCPPTDFQRLRLAAFQSERVASRRRAERDGIAPDAALLDTLRRKAGVAGLNALLTEREAAKAANAARTVAREERKRAQKAQWLARHEAPAGTWRAWFDGSAKPNPGHCTIGAVLTGPAGERIDIARDAGHGNSSQAEYLALIAVLEAALAAGAHGVCIHGDSRVVLDDVGADIHMASPALAALRLRAHALLAQLGGVSLRWVPRHKNGAADALSQRPSDAAPEV